MNKVAIVQSNYLPWKGYFDLINRVDQFIILDDVQYTRRDWRNRNRIKTPHGVKWLTLPVSVKGKFLTPINEILVSDSSWAKKHWQRLEQSYSKAPFFDSQKDLIKNWFDEAGQYSKLSDINHFLIKNICEHLNITTDIKSSSDFILANEKNDKLIQLCKDSHSNCYLSGPAAKGYLDVDKFSKHGIEVEWMNYSGYPEYKQLYGDFVSEVSIIDVIFNCGPDTMQMLEKANELRTLQPA